MSLHSCSLDDTPRFVFVFTLCSCSRSVSGEVEQKESALLGFQSRRRHQDLGQTGKSVSLSWVILVYMLEIQHGCSRHTMQWSWCTVFLTKHGYRAVHGEPKGFTSLSHTVPMWVQVFWISQSANNKAVWSHGRSLI